jgi:hypothetical protein
LPVCTGYFGQILNTGAKIKLWLINLLPEKLYKLDNINYV